MSDERTGPDHPLRWFQCTRCGFKTWIHPNWPAPGACPARGNVAFPPCGAPLLAHMKEPPRAGRYYPG
jgi:hypothetical protein